jgi:hypothetical protein
MQVTRQEGKQGVRRIIKKGDDDCCDYREEVIALVTGCSAKSGVVGGNGGGMPEIAQAWESCARNSLPRRWNAVQHYPQKTYAKIQARDVLWQGHKEMSTSVGARNVFASSSARKRSLSLSQSARHLESKL